MIPFLQCGWFSLLVFMDFIVWNCQGAASKEFRRAARFLVQTYKPCMLALLKTKMPGVATDKVCKSLNFTNWVRVEAVGYSGGIWILWNEDISVTVKVTNPSSLC